MKPLIGLLRFRNEELILQDTLDHLSIFCDKIYVFDDASTDNSREIAEGHKKVSSYLRCYRWNSNQTREQGIQRAKLFEYARFQNPNSNFLYCDADERFDFDFDSWDGESAVTMRLFDARMTEEDCQPYCKGLLKDFRRYFDPQFREIPFIFNDKAKYIGVDCERYPQVDQPVIHAGFVQHYGKALSKKHWQDTCNYYAKYMPVYAEKWEARKKESGVVSSKGLLTWDECVKLN